MLFYSIGQNKSLSIKRPNPFCCSQKIVSDEIDRYIKGPFVMNSELTKDIRTIQLLDWLRNKWHRPFYQFRIIEKMLPLCRIQKASYMLSSKKLRRIITHSSNEKVKKLAIQINRSNVPSRHLINYIATSSNEEMHLFV